MTVENKDVIRVEDTPANLALNLKDQMMAYDPTGGGGGRFAFKDSGSVMRFVSNDTLQVLLAGTQTITGLKTFTQNIIMTASKLLTLDQIGGLRMAASDKYVLSDNDSGYSVNELLSIFGGKLDIQNRNNVVTPSTPILKFNDFSTDSSWTKTAGFTIGSGVANFAHSDGTDDLKQSSSQFQSVLHGNQWYKLTYDITASNGTPTVVVKGLPDVAIDLTVATLKVLYFKTLGSASEFKIDVTGSIAGDSFSIDNLILALVPGDTENITSIGNLELSQSGDIASTGSGSANKSGYIGGPTAISTKQGLQFDSNNDARFTERLDVGSGNNDAAGLMAEGWKGQNRLSMMEVQSTSTTDAGSGTMLWDLRTSNDGMATLLVFVNGIKNDESLGVGAVYMVAIRTVSLTVTQLGTAVELAKLDEFTDTVITFSINGSNQLVVNVTGSAGDTILWTSQIIGHGTQLGDREVA